MKFKLIYILMPALMTFACSSHATRDEQKKINPVITLQTVAAFKSAENVYENDWKLVFRKIDDCQYILLYTDILKMNSLQDNLILNVDNKYITNNDFVNLRFTINYVEETALNPVTGENTVIYRLKDIQRSASDRFLKAGFDDDIKADNFILNLKNYVKKGSTTEIAELVHYPITVIIKKKKLKLNTPEEFIQRYDSIFNAKIRDSILIQPLADIKATSKGLIIGKDEIRINLVEGEILITVINN